MPPPPSTPSIAAATVHHSPPTHSSAPRPGPSASATVVGLASASKKSIERKASCQARWTTALLPLIRGTYAKEPVGRDGLLKVIRRRPGTRYVRTSRATVRRAPSPRFPVAGARRECETRRCGAAHLESGNGRIHTDAPAVEENCTARQNARANVGWIFELASRIVARALHELYACYFLQGPSMAVYHIFPVLIERCSIRISLFSNAISLSLLRRPPRRRRPYGHHVSVSQNASVRARVGTMLGRPSALVCRPGANKGAAGWWCTRCGRRILSCDAPFSDSTRSVPSPLTLLSHASPPRAPSRSPFVKASNTIRGHAEYTILGPYAKPPHASSVYVLRRTPPAAPPRVAALATCSGVPARVSAGGLSSENPPLRTYP
ncbi:hypothetical protein HYPSUDRAFT_570931 [Hypholoma sublateritium FD-334 SS-4]|uniref:Uncharacterized protein n=1 Tax=Hypholoma sublateritium (strain FD-334 SS-4) TaxID=945553 RepID=A0A0D2P519_HYPSF|nr:hypothetical protein HYPSUDRAFT_570931 [Hypholoma sublateritium FD-334 SS-4]